MRQDVFRVRFYLVGGQTVERILPISDGRQVDLDSLNEFAEAMKDTERLWISDGKKGAFAIPKMANVAMVEVEGIGDHEQF